MKLKIIEPKIDLIEKTAGEFAGVFYDACRSSNMKIIQLQGKTINLLKYKGPKQFARAHFEKFIPAATHSLIEILSKETTSEEKKRVIYEALMERVNDDQLNELGKATGLPEFEKTILYKPDDEKPKPVIINTKVH
jgi:RNA-binding protein YhbY